jgi:uncharacterized protein (TIGR00269 family)
MRCHACEGSAVIDQPLRCADHFLEDFERKVERTIEDHGLIIPGERVAVAVSGGKDSLTVLTLLKRRHEVTAIAIDEGIAGYRDQTLEDARRVCAEYGIPLIIRSYKDLVGMTLDEMMAKKPQHPCTVCGALRRQLLNATSVDFDVLATGHNADDEAQAVLMNIIRGNTEIFPRGGPLSGNGATGSEGSEASPEQGNKSFPRFVRRVKPLYFCTEKEVMVYAFLKGLATGFTECPNIQGSYRHIVRDELNSYAQSHPGVRGRLLCRFLIAKQAFPPQAVTLAACSGCGQPSSKDPCRACVLIQEFAKY